MDIIKAGDFMGKTSTASKQRYNEKAYDRIALTVKKGAKAKLQEAAKEKGESINGYIKNAVKAQYSKDSGDNIEL